MFFIKYFHLEIKKLNNCLIYLNIIDLAYATSEYIIRDLTLSLLIEYYKLISFLNDW